METVGTCDWSELYDKAHSEDKDYYDTMGRNLWRGTYGVENILFVVYTERAVADENDKPSEAIRLISARLAANIERGIYYGKRS